MTCVLPNFVPLGMLSVFVIVASASARVGYEVDSKKNNEENCVSDDGSEYTCSVGHCCADSSCCTYYYELWWFWLIWTMIILMSCCCAYHHRKKRRSLQAQRNRNNPLLEPFSAACSYPGPPVDKGTLGFCKLPKYEEIARIPPSGSPPPPYRSCRALNTLASIETNAEGVTSMKFLSYNDITSSVLSLVNSVGFNFGQRNSHERQNGLRGRPQSGQTPDEFSVTDSIASVSSKITDSAKKNSGIHIIPCMQEIPPVTLINELDHANTQDDLPCSSTNVVVDSTSNLPHGNNEEETLVISHKPPIEIEENRCNKVSGPYGKVHRMKCAPHSISTKPTFIAADDSASSDDESFNSVYCEVDENNNDSMQSVYLSPGDNKSKSLGGKIVQKLLR